MHQSCQETYRKNRLDSTIHIMKTDSDKKIELNELNDIIFHGAPVTITPRQQKAIDDSYDFLAAFSHDKVIYGINTGFGPMAQYRIDNDSLTALQYNIIRSHSTGAGEPLTAPYVKAAMVARLYTFLQGKSGVHRELTDLLVQFINNDIYPYIPEHGSVGASGDLVQLAHMALALIGEGDVFYHGEKRPTRQVLDELGLQPFKMHIREGLSVSNGTSVMTGIGIVNLIYAKKLLHWATVAAVMMNEIASSYDDFQSKELNATKRHRGQRAVAAAMRSISCGSHCLLNRQAELYNQRHEEKIFEHKVQPYYSLRCVPQVLGPVFDTLANCEQTLVDEVNSACDNPIVDAEHGTVYHGGNFHGDYVSFEMDKLKIAVTKLTMLCERQANYLFHDRINGILPPFVNMGTLGLNYGLQASQFLATSTTAECQTLSNPMYVHSIPNNNDNQDIVSMGTNSALIARRVVDNSFQVMSVLYMGMVQAVDCLGIADRLAPATRRVYDEVRSIFPAFKEDAALYPAVARVIDYLKEKDLKDLAI